VAHAGLGVLLERRVCCPLMSHPRWARLAVLQDAHRLSEQVGVGHRRSVTQAVGIYITMFSEAGSPGCSLAAFT
jgi:hypothetical protein